MNYNSYILGIRNYYETASHVNVDFAEIYYQTLKTLYNRLKPIANYGTPRSPPPLYKKLFKNLSLIHISYDRGIAPSLVL